MGLTLGKPSLMAIALHRAAGRMGVSLGCEHSLAMPFPGAPKRRAVLGGPVAVTCVNPSLKGRDVSYNCREIWASRLINMRRFFESPESLGYSFVDSAGFGNDVLMWYLG